MIDGLSRCIIEVRCVGNVFEARTQDGFKAAIGFSPEEAVAKVEKQVPEAQVVIATFLEDPYRPEAFDSDPEDELEGGR